MIYLGNGISPRMMSFEDVRVTHTLSVTRISGWQAGNILRSGPFISVYGHMDSAKLLARYWHIRIPVSRDQISLGPEDTLIIASTQRHRMREIGYDREHKPIFRFYLVQMVENRP